MDNISALKNLYASLGGSLTDSYDDIADGAKVGDYSQIADGICACAKVSGANGSVTFTGVIPPTLDADHCSMDVELDEIISALNSGKNVKLVLYIQAEDPTDANERYVLNVETFNIGETANVSFSCILGTANFAPVLFYGVINADNIHDFPLLMKSL